MAKVSAQLVKELRELTGGGMLDCKKALEATDGDVKAAAEWLRENGMLKAAKKSERVAAEGLCGVKTNATHAVVYEVNSETDFVAKNDKFLDLLDTIGDALLLEKPTTLEAALQLTFGGETLEAIITQAVAIIGEKITLRRFAVLEKPANGIFGAYSHMGGRIAVLTAINGTTDEKIAKNIAMHIAGINPLAITTADLPTEIVESKRRELTNEAIEEGKPANIAEKIVEGRMSKYFSESVLVEQSFVVDPDIKVGKYLADNNAEVVEFIRYACGEGIEKQEVDFATEVMSQVR
jgi:translation elongation factor Ts